MQSLVPLNVYSFTKADGVPLQFSDGGSPVNKLNKDNPGNDFTGAKSMAGREAAPHFGEALHCLCNLIVSTHQEKPLWLIQGSSSSFFPSDYMI